MTKKKNEQHKEDFDKDVSVEAPTDEFVDVEAPIEESVKTEEPKTVTEPDTAATVNCELKAENRNTLGQVVKNFKASSDGWFTSANDSKTRYNPGVFSNNQIGTFGTLRVFEDGKVEFVKHTDFDKRVKRLQKTSEEFIVKKISETSNKVEEYKVLVTF